jgi:oligoendopeptidase F
MSTRTVLQRSDIAPGDTWDTANIFPSDDAWEAEIAAIGEVLPGLAARQGHIGDSANALADWLQLNLDLSLRSYRVALYANMLFEVDTADQAASGRRDRALSLIALVGAALSFTEPELLSIGFETLRAWASTSPRLAMYGHYFDTLEKLQAHVRSAEIEELLGLVQDPFRTAGSIHGVLADTDLVFAPAHSSTGESIAIEQGNIDALLTDPDPEVRRTAFEGYADGHLALKNSMARCLAAGVKQDVFRARARRHSSSLEAALAPNHIPVAVFHSLIEAYKRHLPTWHRYWALRRRFLGTAKLRVCDIKAPLIAESPHVTFAQAFEWILQGMQPLGEEYVSVMKRGVL